MKQQKPMVVFKDKFPYLGPLFWVMSLQYVVVQLIVAADWKHPGYSWSQNAISDLGNTFCGQYGSRLVCSPLHDVMNVSFVVLGLTMIGGAWLIYQEFRENRGSAVGFSGMAAAGFGTILVGLFPENTIGALHGVGAILALLIGNIALIVLSFSLNVSKLMKFYTLLTGVVTVIAFVLFASSNYYGLGLGGMERLAGYPQTLWLIIFGLYMTRSHFRTRGRG